MALKLANNATSTLASSIADDDTSLSVVLEDAVKFPSLGAGDWFPLTLIDGSSNMEIVRVTARTSNTMTIVRAQEGTIALAFAAGTRVGLRITAAALAALGSADAINGATEKATPADADAFGFRNSSGGGFVKATWAQLKAAFIGGSTAKTAPVDADAFALADSAASGAVKKLTWANLVAAIWPALGALIAAGTAKATPVDADAFALSDSAASNASKKLTFAALTTWIASKGFLWAGGEQEWTDLQKAQAAANLGLALPHPIWQSKGIGELYAVDDSIEGVDIPPTDNPTFRYIKLTASDAYNTGVLTSEASSGSAPDIVATAVISLADSPLNGKTVPLINTDRRFLRAGAAGTKEQSQNLSHSHTGNTNEAPNHSHAAPGPGTNLGGSTGSYAPGDGGGGGTGLAGAHSHTVTINADGGAEARPANIGFTFFMRIL